MMRADPADMVGNLVAKVATWCRAEPGDLYAATRMGWSDGRPALGSADLGGCRPVGSKGPYPGPDSVGQQVIQPPGYRPRAIGTIGDHGVGHG